VAEIDSNAYCADLLQQGDRDRYLTSLYAPPEKRMALHALYALNLELARVAEVVSEPLLGEIRLQWWREALDGIYAGVPRHHAVVEALARMIDETGLEREIFEPLIDARASDLEEAPFGSLDDVVCYLGDTSSTVMALAARILAPDADQNAARPGGVAWGLAGIVRSIGFHAGQGRCLLPRDLLNEQKLDAHDLVHRRMSPELGAVVRHLVQTGEQMIAECRRLVSDIPRTAVPAYLPVTLAASDFRALRRVGYNPFSLEGRPRPGRLLNLIVRGLLGRP